MDIIFNKNILVVSCFAQIFLPLSQGRIRLERAEFATGAVPGNP